MASLPVSNIGIFDRGRLAPGYLADVVVFDAGRVQLHASYDDTHRYATGVEHVFVNGVHTLRAGEHTGAKAGRAVGLSSARRAERAIRRRRSP